MKGTWDPVATFDNVKYWLNRAWRKDLTRLAIWNGKDWQYCILPEGVKLDGLTAEKLWGLMADCKRHRTRSKA